MASPVNVRTTTQGSNVRTTLPREGIDIGPLPDFWGDLNRMQTRLRPRAKEQERSLREPRPFFTPQAQQQQAPSMPRYDRYNPQPTARQFARPSLSPQGVMGYYVNPLDVPADLVGRIPTGFFTEDATSNYTYSPTVDPAKYGQYGSGNIR